MHRVIYEAKVSRGKSTLDFPTVITVDVYKGAPIELNNPGCLTIKAAKKVRKELKRAIKAAEKYHGKEPS